MLLKRKDKRRRLNATHCHQVETGPAAERFTQDSRRRVDGASCCTPHTSQQMKRNSPDLSPFPATHPASPGKSTLRPTGRPNVTTIPRLTPELWPSSANLQ